MQDEHILVVDAIEDEVLADGEAAHAWTEVIVAATAEMRTGSEHIKKRSASESMNLSATWKLPLSVAM